MWQTEWADDPAPTGNFGPEALTSAISTNDVAFVSALHWTEHCVECAVPDCYSVCTLYVQRKDQKCARFRYGMFPNRDFRGLFEWGIDIFFRRWGKLESYFGYGLAPPARIRWLAEVDQVLSRGVSGASEIFGRINKKRRLNGAYYVLRDKLLRKLGGKSTEFEAFDEFVVEAWNPGLESFSLVLEVHSNKLLFRTSLLLEPGRNVHKIPAELMSAPFGEPKGRILLSPEGDIERRVIFTWLDFVRYKDRALPHNTTESKTKKVKCVVWDLDNTLWKGILLEDGVDGVLPNEEAIFTIKELDKRGIVQSVASKNEYSYAWKLIEKLGLCDYFLYPAIHWGPKSGSIRQIAKELNINLDTVVFVDDSAFERAEVSVALPTVRTYRDDEIGDLLLRPEFDVPVSVEGSARRLSYLMEAKRKDVKSSYGENYEQFLRDCHLVTTIYVPNMDEDVDRCLELILRSNQLNLTTRRYTLAEFSDVIKDPNVLCLATKCRDRFGNYGTVGFASIKLNDGEPFLMDLVMSCRVAMKKIENAWFQRLLLELQIGGWRMLETEFYPSERNGVLLNVLEEVGFRDDKCKKDEKEERSGKRSLGLGVEWKVPMSDVVSIELEGVTEWLDNWRKANNHIS